MKKLFLIGILLAATFSLFFYAHQASADIQYMGYYWAYSSPQHLGDFMDEVAPFSNFISINPVVINTDRDDSLLNAARRAKSLGMKVILYTEPYFFGGNPEDLLPNWRDVWNSAKPTIKQMVDEGLVHAFYVNDEPYGSPAITKSDLETAIAAMKADFPGIPTIITEGGIDGYRLKGVPNGLDIASTDDYDNCDKNHVVNGGPGRSLRWLLENTNLKILITTEAFDLFCQPNIDQQSGYVELALSSPRVIGLWHFAYTDRICFVPGSRECWKGTRAYPEVINYHKQIFNTYIKPANKPPIGNFDGFANVTTAYGWALDPDTPSQSISVHFYVDGPAGSGTFAGASTANLPRPDVNQATGYPGDHGFVFSIPNQFRDGKTHTLYVYGIDSGGGNNPQLSGSPKSFRVPVGNIIGRIWNDLNGNGIYDSGEPYIQDVGISCSSPAFTLDGVFVTNVSGPQNFMVKPRNCNPQAYYDSGVVTAGTYTVGLIPPSGWIRTTSNVQTTVPDGGIASPHPWFGIKQSQNNAACLGISAPTSISAGQNFSASITMKNTGTKPWTIDETPHKLGSQNPQDNTRWGTHRLELPASPVNPGQSVTLTGTFRAPSNSGTYPFDWRMVEEILEWFGETCSATITVNPAPSSTGTIQGYKVVMPGNQIAEPASSQTVSFDGGSPTSANPYFFTNVSATTHTVSVTVPSGWSVGYTLCYNSTSCHTNSPITGNSVTVNVPAGGYADLWWHYIKLSEPPSPLSVSCSVFPTSAIVGQNVTWTASVSGGTGSYSYSWSGDSPLAGQTGNPVTLKYSTAGTKTGSVTVASGTESITKACDNSVSVSSPSLLPPSPPSNLTLSPASCSQINLSWKDNSNNEDGFKIERKIGSGGSWSQIATVAANATNYQNTALSGNTTYSYRVKAYNSAGDSSYSNEASITTGSCLDTSPPTAPTNLSAQTVSSSQIDLSWTASTDNVGVAGYKIYRCQGSSCSPETQISVSQTLSYQDLNLAPDTVYTYAVSAYDTAANVSTKSAAISAKTLSETGRCSPAPVKNGTVAPYPDCTITCDSGYVLLEILGEKACAIVSAPTSSPPTSTPGPSPTPTSTPGPTPTPISVSAKIKQLQSEIQSVQQSLTDLTLIIKTNPQNPEISNRLVTMVQKVQELENKLQAIRAEPSSLAIFTRNLYLGSQGEEVKKLQEFLAKDKTIYPEGVISGYFGLLTQEAIIRFQEKYANEILVPFGLTRGTGYVGPATLKKLNELAR